MYFVIFQLMMYNDIIQSCHPGGFHLLPLGQRALDKLIKVIDEELEAIGAQKISMPSLAPAKLWMKTGLLCLHSMYMCFRFNIFVYNIFFITKTFQNLSKISY